MNKNTGALLRDIRNMKKHQTQKDIISSVKEFKKARSSQQIQLNQLIDVEYFHYLRIKMRKSKTLIKDSNITKQKLKKTIMSLEN